MRRALELADRHDFVIAADECYADIYADEATAPAGCLAAARAAAGVLRGGEVREKGGDGTRRGRGRRSVPSRRARRLPLPVRRQCGSGVCG